MRLKPSKNPPQTDAPSPATPEPGGPLEVSPRRSGSGVMARSLLFMAGQWLLTFVYVPLALLIAPLPFPTRFRIISQWARLNLRWLKLTCRLDYRIRGLENIPQTPCIVMCKHQSAWETLALQKWFHPQVWVLKRSLLWIPLFGWGLAALRPIAIDRGAGRKAVAQIIQQGRERLESGIWVIIFPEGTRVPAGQRGRYRMGGTVLAEKTGYPIVPVAHNAGEYWPRNSFRKYPGTIQVVIGKPISSRERSAGELISEVENWIEGRMEDIGGPSPSGTTAHTGPGTPPRP